MLDNEFPDTAGYPDGQGGLDEGVDEPLSDVAFVMVESFDDGLITAIVGDEEMGRVRAHIDGKRLVVDSTYVWPEYRGQGIASEMARRTLDGALNRGQTVTVNCPTFARFLEKHGQYRGLVDHNLPGSSTSNRP